MRLGLVSPAIVLRSHPFGESDKIVSFFSEHHGKLSGIAKGALRSRRRFVNSLEPFSVVNLSFQDRPQSGLAFLLSAELIHGPQALLADLDRIAVGDNVPRVDVGARHPVPAGPDDRITSENCARLYNTGGLTVHSALNSHHGANNAAKSC